MKLVDPATILTPSELHYWRSFRPKRAEEWLLGRMAGKLAVVKMGRKLGKSLDPQEIEFTATEKGPCCTIPTLPPLDISLSHSSGLGFAGVTLAAAGQIGVDVERLSPRDYERLAFKVLSPEEHALCMVHHGSLAVGFTVMWTLKEAFLKALGIGLTISPRRVTVDFQGTRGDALVSLAVEAIHGTGKVLIRGGFAYAYVLVSEVSGRYQRRCQKTGI